MCRGAGGASRPSYLRLMRLPANHVEDVEGGRDRAVLTAVHLCQHTQECN